MIKELDQVELKEADFTGPYDCFDVLIEEQKNLNLEEIKKQEKSLKKKRNRPS